MHNDLAPPRLGSFGRPGVGSLGAARYDHGADRQLGDGGRDRFPVRPPAAADNRNPWRRRHFTAPEIHTAPKAGRPRLRTIPSASSM